MQQWTNSGPHGEITDFFSLAYPQRANAVPLRQSRTKKLIIIHTAAIFWAQVLNVPIVHIFPTQEYRRVHPSCLFCLLLFWHKSLMALKSTHTFRIEDSPKIISFWLLKFLESLLHFSHSEPFKGQNSSELFSVPTLSRAHPGVIILGSARTQRCPICGPRVKPIHFPWLPTKM